MARCYAPPPPPLVGALQHPGALGCSNKCSEPVVIRLGPQTSQTAIPSPQQGAKRGQKCIFPAVNLRHSPPKVGSSERLPATEQG